MFYSILATIFLATIVITSPVPTDNSNEENVFARFYPDFVQLYRPATIKSYVDPENKIERYQFVFTKKEYLTISVESLTMINTNVIDRTITYHPFPNFEVNGTRYFYRRSSKDNESIEIELVDAKQLLFREVKRPERYFYLPSFRNLEYPNQVPVIPYYEVTFLCNSSFPPNTPKRSPLLTYIDRSFQYQPHYLVDVPSPDTDKQVQMTAYADICNNGDKTVVLKEVEIIAGDVKLDPKSTQYLHTGVLYRSNNGALLSVSPAVTKKIRVFVEGGTGTYVYQLSLPSSVTFPPRSSKSLQFFTPNVTVNKFASYSSVFLPYSVSGQLYKAYNLTSCESLIPAGRLVFQEEGRFVGQVNLPDLLMNETYTTIFGYDPDVNYRREVKVVDDDVNSDSVTYKVKYFFKNTNVLRDVRVSFSESFSLFKYYEIKNLLTSGDEFVSQSQYLRGSIYLPHQSEEKMVSYKLIIYKYKPVVNKNDE